MPRKLQSYLSQIRFDEKLRNKWWAKYILNFRLVILLIITIVIVGSVSFLSIPRRLNPEVKIPIVIITTILPGAAPSDIEQLLTVPLEDKVDGINGIDTMVSNSRENASVITMQFLSSVDGKQALQDVQTALGGITGLPDNAQKPVVTLLDFEDQPIWTFAVTSRSDTASLMRFSQLLKNKIKDLPRVDRVATSGFDTQEIQVIINPVKINEYGINPVLLSQLVKKATASYPAGSIKTDQSTFALTIDKDVVSIEDVRKLRITNGGRSFFLSDIADVVERSKLNQPQTYLSFPNTSAKKAVQFFIFKAKNVNIDAAEKDAHKVVDETIKTYDGQFTVTTVMNTAEEITKQFNDLYDEFRSTIILVFLLLFVFLGFRQAAISSLTVPLTFLSAFTIINVVGLSLNFLTLFAFLLALGLLIDDTIVTVAAMTRYYRTNRFTATETGILVWRDFIVPLWSTTITTIWAFVPLILTSGIIGEFIKSIPIVVTATMVSSTSIAVLITLPLMIIILKPQLPKRVKILLTILLVIGFFIIGALIIPRSPIFPLVYLFFIVLSLLIYATRKQVYSRINSTIGKKRVNWFVEHFNNGFINIENLSDYYKDIIDRVLLSKKARRGILIGILVFAVVGYSFVPLGLVKNEFFPKTDQDIIYMQIELPAGTNLEIANKEMLNIMNRIKYTENVNYMVGESGASLSETGGRNEEPGNILLTLHLIAKEKRKISSQTIADKLRDEFKNYSKGKISVVELSSGPPAGSDLQVGLLGDDLSQLDSYTQKVVDFLKKQPNVTNVSSSNKASTSKIVFVPDKVKMADANITPDALGLWLRSYASGFTLDTIKINNDDTDVTFLMGNFLQKPDSLSSIFIPTQTGSVQLLSLGSLRLETNPTQIIRKNGKRIVTVSASVTKGVSATEKNKDLLKFTNSLRLPEGYSWETGGVNDENAKSVQSILRAMIISFLLILITMVIEFSSFRQTMIALLIIPLSISGVFYVFALTGTPLSFPALIGLLALFGIVVTHAIVVIEKINDNRRHGMNLHDSLVDAARNRLEPVLLTSLATIVGLVPITLADPLWRGLGGAIIAGLLFSGAIKLFFVPITYYMWFQSDEEKKNRKI